MPVFKEIVKKAPLSKEVLGQALITVLEDPQNKADFNEFVTDYLIERADKARGWAATLARAGVIVTGVAGMGGGATVAYEGHNLLPASVGTHPKALNLGTLGSISPPAPEKEDRALAAVGSFLAGLSLSLLLAKRNRIDPVTPLEKVGNEFLREFFKTKQGKEFLKENLGEKVIAAYTAGKVR